MIKLLKEGISVELAKTILNWGYGQYISFLEDSVYIKKEIIGKMVTDNVNEILIFEIWYFTT
jgi:hypothetical protein